MLLGLEVCCIHPCIVEHRNKQTEAAVHINRMAEAPVHVAAACEEATDQIEKLHGENIRNPDQVEYAWRVS